MAFAVLSISLGVLYQIFSTSLRNTALTTQYTYAMIIAESQLADAFKEVPDGAFSSQGTVDDLYQWQVSVAPYQQGGEENDGIFTPYSVKVVVTWKDGLMDRQYELDTLRLAASGEGR